MHPNVFIPAALPQYRGMHVSRDILHIPFTTWSSFLNEVLDLSCMIWVRFMLNFIHCNSVYKVVLHWSVLKRNMVVMIWASIPEGIPPNTASISWLVIRDHKHACDTHICLLRYDGANHSVESPSMVDPQWNIWYWGSKRNLHTVCWSAVGCEWGTTSVYFGITYVCFMPSRLPVFAVESQYLLQYFLFLSKVSFELHIQNLQKISCWFKIWMGFVGPILIKLWTSSIWGFL